MVPVAENFYVVHADRSLILKKQDFVDPVKWFALKNDKIDMTYYSLDRNGC